MMSRAVVGLQNLLSPASENLNAVIVSRQVLQAKETQYIYIYIYSIYIYIKAPKWKPESA